MRASRLTRTLAAAALVLAGGAPARAASVAPPGNSAVNQYFESVPAAGGSQPPATGGGRGRDAALSPGTRAALVGSGPDGRAAAALAAAGAPPAVASPPATRVPDRRPATPDPAPFRQRPAILPAFIPPPRASAGVDGAGISPVLPAVLGAAALGAVALVLIRRRGAARPPPPAT